jgi:ABC-type lipoprotein export system ATPase subunit
VNDVATNVAPAQTPGTAAEEPAVRLRDVFAVHRTPEGDAAALQGLTLDVAAGELLCVLGPSGAGKSTLLRVVAGLQTPSAGEVFVLTEEIGRLPERARARLRHTRFGFLGQHAAAAVSPDLSVAEAVSIPLALRGMPRRQQRARVSELLEAAGLSPRASAGTRELSGGERQRVALCVALAHRPQLLLADEPTGELDAESAAAMLTAIAELVRAHGATAIVVSHDRATAEIADRAVRIRDGRVVEDRRDGESALVVGRGGWIRLPPELLAEAGIGDRARVKPAADGLIVSAAVGAGNDPGEPRAAVPSFAGGWSPSLIEARSLTRVYGRGSSAQPVLAGLSHAFAPGALTIVTGRSGAGKSTLLRLLAGLDRPASGEVTIDDQHVGGLDDEGLAALRRRRIGFLPQEPAPIDFLSAEENVLLALRIRGWDPLEADRRTSLVITLLGLADRARQRVARLSAGEAQRVALGRALASARGLLIVDEPTSRLDEAHAAEVASLLADTASRDRQTVICATHDERVIERADAVLAL